MSRCKYPGYDIECDQFGFMIFIHGRYMEADAVTGVPERQITRSWLIESDDDPSSIVRTVFKCILTSMEHRTREFFTYKGVAVMQPHFDVDAVVAAALAEKGSEG